MICALFPGMMISRDCENCSTENVTPYTPEDLEKFSLEVEDVLDEQSITIVKKIGLLSKLLENTPTGKNKELSELIDSLYDDYISYLHYNYQKATLETIGAMATESDNYLLINKITEPVNQFELEKTLLLYEDLTREIDSKYDTLELYYDPIGGARIDYKTLVDDLLSLYKELTDLNTRYAKLVTEYTVSAQAEKQEILTRGLVICETPGAGDSLQDYQQYYLTSFVWVKAWIGVYSSQVPNTTYFIGQFCTGTKNTLNGYLNAAIDNFGAGNVGSIQVKYFFLANYGIYQHNAIYEGNKSVNNLNGNYYVGNNLVSFTNGAGWTYGATYDGSSTPSNGTYTFDVNENWFITYQACCIPSWPPDNTVYAQWCNKHCSGCFACDDGADQNFFYED